MYLNRVETMEEIDKALEMIVTRLADCEVYASIYDGFLDPMLSICHPKHMSKCTRGCAMLYLIFTQL